MGVLAFVPLLPPRAPMPASWPDAPPLPLPAAAPLPRTSPNLVTMALLEAPPKPKIKSSAVTRRGGGQLISWYFNSISSTRLLSAEQEQCVARVAEIADSTGASPQQPQP